MLPFDPHKPLYGFTARCPHAHRRIHLFADERFVYFRPKNAAPDWCGALRAWDTLIEQVKVRDWVEVVRWAGPDLRESHFFRVFDLPDPCPNRKRVWRILWRDDFAFALPENHASELDGAFFWPQPSNFSLWRTPTAQLQNHFKREWHDPRSDVRAALEWCDWTLDERQNRAVRWEAGSEAELRRVVETAMKIVPWDVADAGYKRIMNACWSDGQPLEIRFHSQESREFFRLMKPLLPVLEARNRSFYDHRNADRRDWRLDLNSKATPHPQSFGHGLWFEVEAPTQHERLEAALFLREWLQTSAPNLSNDWFSGAA